MRKRGRETSMSSEIHQSVASCTLPTGYPLCNSGMCPDWELIWWPFGLQANTESTEPHQPKLFFLFIDVRQREKETSLCCSTHLCIRWLLLACAWPEIKPVTVTYRDNTLTKWATWPGQVLYFVEYSSVGLSDVFSTLDLDYTFFGSNTKSRTSYPEANDIYL